MPEITYQFLVTIKARKPITDLVDIIAGRCHTIDNVVDTSAAMIIPDNRTPQPATREEAIERQRRMTVVVTSNRSL